MHLARPAAYLRYKADIDRFEGGYAICEEEGVEKLFGIDRQELPQDAKEGDVIEITDEGGNFGKCRSNPPASGENGCTTEKNVSQALM